MISQVKALFFLPPIIIAVSENVIYYWFCCCSSPRPPPYLGDTEGVEYQREEQRWGSGKQTQKFFIASREHVILHHSAREAVFPAWIRRGVLQVRVCQYIIFLHVV